MSFRDTFSSNNNKPKIKISKPTLSNLRRLQTEHYQNLAEIKKTQNHFNSTHRIQVKKQPQRSKYLQVTSKLQNQQISNKKPYKVQASRQYVLNKFNKTQTDEQFVIARQGHQRRMTERIEIKIQQHPSEANIYEIDGVAGKGTFGTVFHGHVRSSGKKIAIKKVLQDKRYKNRQLQILKILKHPNLLEMKDYFMSQQQDKEYLNVVMDYFSQNLYQAINKKPMNPFLIKIYLYQIMRGLMYLSFKDIAHRDMKPHNVLVDSQTNKVVICDFGSAKQLVKGQSNLAYICSRCYRAPELIFGATNYTSQIDIWSVGCILVEMINGEPPFLGDSQIDQLIQIIKIMGTPSKDQILEMNPDYNLKDYGKFPLVKKTQWKNVLKTNDPLLIDLVHNLMQYSPKRRFTAEQALKHKYFDTLREHSGYRQMIQHVKFIPELFDFIPEELQKIQNPLMMIPKRKQINQVIDSVDSKLLKTNKIKIDSLNVPIINTTKILSGREARTDASTNIYLMRPMRTLGSGVTKRPIIQITARKQI